MKKVIIISAINLRSGGTLSILNDCLKYLDNSLSQEYKIIALVHKKSIIIETKNIEYLEFSKSISSYFKRLYYEYIHFKKISLKLKPYLWLSLHDITPNVNANIRAVYCHNPTPFYKIKFKDFLMDYKFGLFCLFYKYLYKINISKNNYVIVQQEWIRDEFVKMYNINECIVAYPVLEIKPKKSNFNNLEKKSLITFIYPAFPRVFKNFEVICEASMHLTKMGIHNFEVLLTIDGTENKYSRYIFNKYKSNNNIKFIGLQTREKLFELYEKADCLIFPSKLETWGLPITEFKQFNKPIILADLRYSYETVGKYDKVIFFEPNDYLNLAKIMKDYIEGNLFFKSHEGYTPKKPFANNWQELFEILLGRNNI